MPLLEIATPILLLSFFAGYKYKHPPKKIDEDEDDRYEIGFIIDNKPCHMVPKRMSEDELEEFENELIKFCKNKDTINSKIEGALVRRIGEEDTVFEYRILKKL